MNAKIEIVHFYNDRLVCPVINGEPYTIINNITETIGLSERAARRGLTSHPRLNKYILYVQVKNSGTDQYLSFEKHGEKGAFLTTKCTQSVPEFSLKGYKYLSLPIRKIPGWLYSIDMHKVKPEVRPVLERYQDECDTILFSYFFGIVYQRKKLLGEKAILSKIIALKEEALLQNPDYQELLNLKAEEMRMGKSLKEFDNQEITVQKCLWDQDFIKN